MQDNYVAVHNHDSFSYGDSITPTKDLILAAKNQGCPAINLSNHGNMASIMEFTELCAEEGIKPIIGSELYFAKDGCERERKSNHLLVNIADDIGYSNMLKLMYFAATPVEEGGGYFGRPRITEKLLFANQEGLIVSSACVAGAINEFIADNDMLNATLMAERMKENIQHFFLEIMPHHFDLQTKCNLGLVEIAKKLNIPLLLSTDSHYPNADYHEAYKVNTRSNRGNTEENYDDGFLPEPDLWIRPQDDVIQTFKGQGLPDWAIQQAIDNTHVYNELVRFDFKKPHFDMPEISENADVELKRLAEIGLIKKFGGRSMIPKEYVERAKHELRVIARMGYSNYFLILHDFIRFYKSDGSRILGPGRGSACGSILLWLLGITQVDSIQVGLPFERFLNEERITPPDVDIDLMPEYREQVKDYLRQKYGQDRVIEIGNHSKAKPKMALKDAGRALGIPVETINQLNKNIPDRGEDEDGETIQMHLEDAMRLPGVQPYVEEYPTLFEMALKLEGTYRSQGKHAAGVCITPVPVYECVPVNRRNGVMISQWDKKQLESIGIQKFDLLGLSTLSILKDCCEITGVKLEEIPLDDEQTWDYLCAAKNMEGIFQFHSVMMRNLLREIKPRNMEELAHVNAIGRPAVLDAGLHKVYIENKNKGSFEFPFDIPAVKEILAKTHGIVVFQEQVMYIAKAAANFSLGKGDLLRRNFEKYGTPKDRSPKVEKEYEQFKKEFVAGMVANGYNDNDANLFFDWLGNSVGYSFTFNHAYPYSLIGYWTAYFKAKYPAAFYVANLNDPNVMKGKDKKDDMREVEKFIKEAKQQGIKVLRPNFKHSHSYCAVVDDRTIVLGLCLLNGIGDEVSKTLARKNTDLAEFLEWFVTAKRSNGMNRFNKRHMQALLAIGYFDVLDPNNKRMGEQVWEGYQNIIYEQNEKERIKDWEQRKAAGRKVRPYQPAKENPEPFEPMEEQEVLGFNLDSPLDVVAEKIDKKYLDENVYVLGLVKSFKRGQGKWGTWRKLDLITLNGEQTCFLKEDKEYIKGQVVLATFSEGRNGVKNLLKSTVVPTKS